MKSKKLQNGTPATAPTGLATAVNAAVGGELLSPAQLAAHLGVPVKTVYKWRTNGDGPRGIRVGRHVRYRSNDVEAWLEAHSDDDA